MGRKVNAFSKDLDYLEHQLTLAFAYYHFVIPHRGLRQRYGTPQTKGSERVAQKMETCDPGDGRRLTDHVWTMDDQDFKETGNECGAWIQSRSAPPHGLPSLAWLWPREDRNSDDGHGPEWSVMVAAASVSLYGQHGNRENLW